MVRSLNVHPKIACLGELLKPNPSLNDLAILKFSEPELNELNQLHRSNTAGFADMIFNRANSLSYLASGFKLFYYHARENAGESWSIWSAIANREDIKVIHLYREDSFSTYLSRQLASATNRWHHADIRGDDPDYMTSVAIDIDDFLQFRTLLLAQISEAAQMLPACRTFTTTYEKFTANFAGSLAEIQEFLDVPSHPTRPPLAKQGRRPWRDYVRNVEEVEAGLRDLRND